MRDEGDMLAGDWQGPPYEYGVTWGPKPLTIRQLVIRVLVSVGIVYALLVAALVLAGV
jgi:hypothetical protein